MNRAVEMDGNTIRIPYTAVNDVLEKLVPAVEGLEIPGINLPLPIPYLLTYREIQLSGVLEEPSDAAEKGAEP